MVPETFGTYVTCRRSRSDQSIGDYVQTAAGYQPTVGVLKLLAY